MDPALRQAWTQIVTPEDYDRHMANIGQAQAAAALTARLIQTAELKPGSTIAIVGAGTGQMFDYLDPELIRPYHLTAADLNPAFLARLQQRLAKHNLQAQLVEDDIEQTRLDPNPGLLLAALLLEHIDWRRGVESLTALKPKTCGIILQENPLGMNTAVTPGRRLPPSIEKAVERAHPTLIPRDELIAAFQTRGYHCRDVAIREVADAKKLVALLFL